MEKKKGAEAIVILYKNIVKKTRNRKRYRVSTLDSNLRKKRTRQEFSILKKAYDIIKVPKPIKLYKYSFTMERVVGFRPKLSESLSIELASILSLLHNKDMIHGDFTPANVIISSKDKSIYIIDFGLGFISKRVEDKADDLLTLIRSMPSYESQILSSYLKKGDKRVVERLEKIKKRARYT